MDQAAAVPVIPQVSLEVMKKCLPANLRNNINQGMVDNFNSTLTDPIFAEQARDNLVGYAHVMKDGKFQMEKYFDAVKYCSYKFMGDSNIIAYTKTFPDRYDSFVQNGTTDKDIASYVTSYNKNKLVQAIMEQSMVPFHVLNMDSRQKALNRQVYLMEHSKSEKVQSDAANSVLTHTKPPETTKIELDIDLKESDAMKELRQLTTGLAAKQLADLNAGVSTVKEVAESKLIIEGDYEEVD